MSFSASFLPPLTSCPTSPLTWAALPEPLKSSASSRFLGAAASIAFCTAAMNALRSNVPGCWAPISSTCAPAAWLWRSLPGGTEAACAAAAPAAAGWWALAEPPAAAALPFMAWKPGSSDGSRRRSRGGRARCRATRTAAARGGLSGRGGCRARGAGSATGGATATGGRRAARAAPAARATRGGLAGSCRTGARATRGGRPGAAPAAPAAPAAAPPAAA